MKDPSQGSGRLGPAADASFVGLALEPPLNPSPKYSALEIERRWIVDPSRLGPILPLDYWAIEDIYFPGTGLRLRRVEDGAGAVVFKLCKKYGKQSDMTEAVTNLYLSRGEFELLSEMGGKVVSKRRYAVAGGSLDMYGSPGGLAVFEIEFDSVTAAQAYHPPAFVGREVTHDPSYSGAAIAARQA